MLATCRLATCLMELIIPSCIRGYHVYGEIWTAVLDEQLFCEREIGNVLDRYAVAAKNDSHITVGHLPRKISTIIIHLLNNFCHLRIG